MRTMLCALFGLALVFGTTGCSSPKMHTVTVDDEFTTPLEFRVGDSVLVRRNAGTPEARLLDKPTDGNKDRVLMPERLGRGGNTLMLIYYKAVRPGTGTIEVERPRGVKKTIQYIVR
jgi:hypothetical protein